MDELENFKHLGISLAIGLLIGLERGWRTREKAEGMRVAGLRTFGLIAMLGGLWGLLAQQAGFILMGFAFLSLTFIFLIAYSKSLNKFEDYSITSMIASLMTFTLGAMTVFGHAMLASSSAVVITFLLGFKPLLHGWMNKLEQHELEATFKLLLISVVMLPILPDKSFDPWAAINPYLIWWMVVLIAGISYLGYFAVKIVGNRHGMVLTGFFGGLVSSSALTLNLSRLTNTQQGLQNVLSAGILTACATLFLRTLLLTAILNPALALILLPALTIMSLITYLAAYLLWKNAVEFQENEDMKLENPFQLGMAVKFGAFLVVILILSRILQANFGDTGAYVLAAVSGLADVDPITLSMAQMCSEGLELKVAATAILIAVAVNSAVKSLFTLIIGDSALALRVGTTLTVAVGAGLVSVLGLLEK
jgi:uncharacterized membrane protein (DUF4010 family)